MEQKLKYMGKYHKKIFLYNFLLLKLAYHFRFCLKDMWIAEKPKDNLVILFTLLEQEKKGGEIRQMV